MPRLFTGVEIPEDIKDELAFMRGGILGARWLDPDFLHLTLRFIGDISLPLAREIADALASVSMKTFTLKLKAIEVLGGNKPHTLCAGIEENADLRRLQALHERLAQVLGLPPEPRRFQPHVTLARLRDPDLTALQRYVVGHNPYSSRTFQVNQFVLFSARPLRGGGPYAVEEAYSLHA